MMNYNRLKRKMRRPIKKYAKDGRITDLVFAFLYYSKELEIKERRNVLNRLLKEQGVSV